MSPENRSLLMRANRLLGAGLVEHNLVKIEDLEKANERLLEIIASNQPRSATVLGVLAYEPKDREKELLEKAIGWSGMINKHNPKGCPKCNSTGYRGRVGIHELMVTNDELIEGINKKWDTAELKKIAQRQGMKTLHQDSLLKVKEGLSTMEEAISTVPPDL